jgi:hypothetical protein
MKPALGSRWISSLLLVIGLALASGDALAEPLRILIAASRSQGHSSERPLKHADDDARSVRDVFVRLGGVAPEHALLLTDPSADELLHAIDRAAHIANGHPADEVLLLFYFSGHGDHDTIHLGEERLPIDVVESRLEQVNASLRIVVLDACRTNDGRPKGFSAVDPFAVVLPPANTAKGVVRIHASADGEVAQESDELGGAVFTHYWVNGLSGAADTNNDSQITLGESYAYAYQQTLWRSAISSGVAQRPLALIELQEAAPLVLTRTVSTSAIRFPLAADTHYIVFGIGSETVVGDLWGAADHGVTLAVPPGHYIVHRRGNGTSSAAEVVVAQGEARALSSGDFVAFSEERLSRKGGDLVIHPDELSVGYGAQATNDLIAFGQEVDVRYTHVSSGWDHWALGGGVHWGSGSLNTSYWNTNLQWVGGDLLLERRIPLGWPTLRIGAGATFDYVLQTLRRTDAAGLAGTPYATQENHQGALGGGRLAVGLRMPLSTRLWLDAEARGDVLGAEVAGAGTVLLGVSGRGAIGWAF